MEGDKRFVSSVRRGSATSTASTYESEENKKTTWISKVFGNKDRKIKAEDGITPIIKTKGTRNLLNHIGKRKVREFFNRQDVYTKLKKVSKYLNRILDSLNNLQDYPTDDFLKITIEEVSNVLSSLKEQAKATNLDDAILQDLQKNPGKISKEDLLKGVNQTLDSITSLQKSMKKSKLRFWGNLKNNASNLMPRSNKVSPVIESDKNIEQNSEDKLLQIKESINNNKPAEIAKMIASGHIDLRNLNNQQLFDILDKTAKKIKPDTMKLLLDKGFDISNVISDKNQNVFSIIDQFSNKVLSLLVDQTNIKNLLSSQSPDNLGAKWLEHYVSEGNLKAVKILFKTFDATDNFNEKAILETATENNDVAMIEYLLGQTKKSSELDLKQHIDRADLIAKAENNKKNQPDKKQQKDASKIISLFEKNFKLSTNVKKLHDFIVYNDFLRITEILSTPKSLDLKKQIGEKAQYDILKLALTYYYDCDQIMDKLNKYGFNFEAKGENGDNILMVALLQGKTTMVKWLFNNNVGVEKLINKKDDGGDTPLNYSILYGNPGIVKFLVEQGADIFIENDYDNNALAIAKRQLEDLEETDEREKEIKIANFKKIISILKDKEAELKTKEETPYNSVLIEETKDTAQSEPEKNQELQNKLQEYLKDESEEIKELFNADKVNLQDKSSEIQAIILSKAVEKFDDTDILKYLSTTGINFTVVSERQANILMDAVYLGKTAMVEWLLNNASKEALIKQQDNKGNTPLHYAISFNNPGIVNLLLDAGASLDITDQDGNNALHYAISFNYLGIVELLLEKGASFETKDKDGDNALNHAIAFNYLDMIELLLKKGANVNAKDQVGNTALHREISFDDPNLDIVKCLLKNGADYTINNEDDKTPLDLANDVDNKQIIKLLEGAYKK